MQTAPTAPPTEIVFTEEFTDEEQRFVDRCQTAPDYSRIAFVCFVVVALGSTIVLLSHARDFLTGTGEIRRMTEAMAIFLPITAFVFTLWQTVRAQRFTRLVVTKMARRTHCPLCRSKLASLSTAKGDLPSSF